MAVQALCFDGVWRKEFVDRKQIVFCRYEPVRARLRIIGTKEQLATVCEADADAGTVEVAALAVQVAYSEVAEAEELYLEAAAAEAKKNDGGAPKEPAKPASAEAASAKTADAVGATMVAEAGPAAETAPEVLAARSNLGFIAGP